MANRQKVKGKSYERYIAKFLSDLTKLSFIRVPNSGAFVGGKNFIRANTLSDEQNLLMEGDIIVPKEWSHIRIECKFYKDIAWQKLFADSGESKLNSWIAQSEQGKRPYWLLCFKVNNAGHYVIFDTTILGPALKWCSNFLIYKNKYCVTDAEAFFNKNYIELQKLIENKS